MTLRSHETDPVNGMSVRTSVRTVTFTRPFVLTGIDGMQTAGSYAVDTNEDVIQTATHPVHRRFSTWIRLVCQRDNATVFRTALVDPEDVDPEDLDAALAKDAT